MDVTVRRLETPGGCYVVDMKLEKTSIKCPVGLVVRTPGLERVPH